MPSSGVQKCALDRKSTRLNSSHGSISYAVFCLKKQNESPALRAWGKGPGYPLGVGNFSMRYLFLFFFFNDTAPTEIYTLSLHDALPISAEGRVGPERVTRTAPAADGRSG